MSGLARLMLNKNMEISGSDLASNHVTESLIKEGIKVNIGHSASHITEGMTVIYTTGIDACNPEYAAALKYQCPLLHRSDLLSQLMKEAHTLAVAGTHGKTTTSALLASVLEHAGQDPTFAVGGILQEYQSNAKRGAGPYFVAEACESDGTFSKYAPYGAILTNVDLDHMDFFGTEAALKDAFRAFIEKVQHPACLFWCADDERLLAMNPPGSSYGFSERANLRIVNQRQEGWSLTFDVLFKGKAYTGIQLPLVGCHNALNGAAVFGLCLELGLPEEAIREGMRAFQGIHRRCEKKGELAGILVLDDYAHHPTEISTTLNGIRQAIGERRLMVLFQPHRYSRTKECLGTFAKAFDAADEVIVTDIYAANESPIAGVNAKKVAEEVSANFRARVHYASRSTLVEYVIKHARPHDVVVSVGAGDITKVGGDLLMHWKKAPPQKWRVGVVFGGRSMEHEVSLMSAKHVVDSLDRTLYDVELFGIKKTGRWVHCLDSLSDLASAGDDETTISSHVLEKLQECDLFFPVLHGPYGEDGSLQGFFDTLGKAYVGCDHRSAALCMDKALTKKIAAFHQIAVVPFLSFSEFEWLSQREVWRARIEQELKLPLFIKPLHLGSTVGISKVTSIEQLDDAVEGAFRVDTHVLVENGLEMREIEFAVMGNDIAYTYPPGEILTKGRMYDYHGKYDQEDPIEAVPQSTLAQEVLDLGMAWAKKAYQAAGCKGLARVDFFLDHEGHLWLNEINPIPGFTKNSLYPKICATNGLPGPCLVSRLIVLALQRKRQLQRSIENI